MRRPATSSSTRLVAFAGVAVALAAAFCVAPGMAVGLAPAGLLLLLLVHGFFPGEQTIARLRGRRHVRVVRPERAFRPRLPHLVRRTGRELAFALAVRPPPAAGAVISS